MTIQFDAGGNKPLSIFNALKSLAAHGSFGLPVGRAALIEIFFYEGILLNASVSSMCGELWRNCDFYQSRTHKTAE